MFFYVKKHGLALDYEFLMLSAYPCIGPFSMFFYGKKHDF